VIDPIAINADPEELERRLDALHGINRVREAAPEASVFLVGGAVRDLLLGRERADVDIVVEGDVDLLAAALGDEVRGHDRFGTATVRLDGLSIDLARARAESYPYPGALPEVTPAAIDEDLARRDFTINAMALPLHGEARLLDPHDGLDDLREGLLRILHPDSFVDDPTRALRAARYAARLGLRLEPGTGRAMAGADLGTVSEDRVMAELRRIAAEPDPAAALALAREWGVLDLDEGRLRLVRDVQATLDRPAWAEVVELTDAILAAATGDLAPARRLAAAEPPKPSGAVEAAHGSTATDLALARAMGAEWLDRYVSQWRDVRLEIGGADLLAAGVAEGPAIGHGLGAALRAKLDGELSGGRDAELEAALAAAREGP
jgi:tRNA nucleotidyltransferase (CCA-adding enzyme)